MPKRTQRQSLERCRKLWAVEAEHGTGDKAEMYRVAGLQRSDMNDCPACEHDSQGALDLCGEECIIPWEGEYCHSDGTSFSTWYDNSEEGLIENQTKPTIGHFRLRKHYAAEIVALCDKALAAL